MNNNGSKTSEKTLLSKLNSINKVFLTNNICESIHGNISNNLQNTSVNKIHFRDTIINILKHYSMKNKQTIIPILNYMHFSLVLVDWQHL